MTREYELMYIVRPDVDEDGMAAAVASVKSLIEGTGGTVLKTTIWGKRRLAYEVKHIRDGNYVIVRADIDPTRVREIERTLTIHETVFRHLLTSAPDITDPTAVQDEDLRPSTEAVPASDDATTTAIADDDSEDEREFVAVGAENDEEGN